MFTRTENFRTFLQLYPAVSLLVGIHLIIWLLFQLPVPPLQILLQLFDGYNAGIANGEYWRLVTPIFLHINFGHFFFNTISLILFAPALERMLGKIKFLLFYIGAGVIANLATYFIEPLQYSHLGASGAIFGLFGAYVFMIYFKKGLIDKANSQIVVSILVIGIIMTFLNTNINVVAHIFGFIGGFILAPFFVRNPLLNNDFSFKYRPSFKPTTRFQLRYIFWIIFGILIFLGMVFRF